MSVVHDHGEGMACRGGCRTTRQIRAERQPRGLRRLLRWVFGR